MKKILSILVLILFVGCGIKKKLFSRASNKFPITTKVVNKQFETWDNENLYVMRVELISDNKVEYEKNNKKIIEILDYPVESYKLITKQLKQPENHNIVEEVYIYLSEFNSNNIKGKALYMSTIPLRRGMTKLIYNNNYFTSTLGISHLMIGEWSKEGNNLKLEVKDEKNEIVLNGKIKQIDKSRFIEFEEIKHPKSSKKEDLGLLNIKDILQVNQSKEDEIKGDVKGIRFFKNNKTFMHPDWDKIKGTFDFERDSTYYRNNYKKRKITKIHIGGKYYFYFEINTTNQDNNYNIYSYMK